MHRRPRRADGYRLTQLKDETLLFHPGRATVTYLNDSASMIWQLCDGRRTAGEIATLLAEAYPEQATTISEDVAATLAEFARSQTIDYV